jgi:amino acid transporter
MNPESAVEPMSGKTGATVEQPRLRRVLGLRDLVFYGVVLIQPIGAIGPFGLADQMSLGHVTLAMILALAAMMLTAWSYGRLAGLYPSSGSAYTYVGKGLHPHLGFVAGWAMFLDYLVIPIVSIVYGALTMRRLADAFVPGLTQKLAALGMGMSGERWHLTLWVVFFTLLITVLNLRGIKWTSLANLVMTGLMFIAIAWFVAAAIRFLWMREGWGGLLSSKTIYNRGTFHWRAVSMATSLAALTYIGFDGITTLAEDTREPKRTVPRAILLTCVVIGFCAVLEVYLGQRVWPDYSSFKDVDTAFFDVCAIVGGKPLFNVMAMIMVVACLGSALTGQVGAARILFGMGRDGALPQVFGRLSPAGNPVINIAMIGALTLGGSLLLNYEKAATLINFGAFLAFMGVNLAVMREFLLRPRPGYKKNFLSDALAPGLGFIFCLTIWLSLPPAAKTMGAVWCAIGLVYAAINTRGFRSAPKMLDLSA